MGIPLYKLADEFMAVKQALEADGVPENVIADTLDGCSMELDAKILAVAAYIRNLEAEATAYEDHATEAFSSAKRLRIKADGLKAYLSAEMSRTQKTAIAGMGRAPSVRLYPERDCSVEVDDMAIVPPEYVVEVPATYKPDKKLIVAALKLGQAVPGTRLVKRDRLEIKA